MKKILVTGGTVFVSRSLAEYFVSKGDEVYVLNRNSRPQPAGTRLIEADRYQLGDALKAYDFDVVIDANSYTGQEMELLLQALPDIKEYIFISSSAVYPNQAEQPFKETQAVGPNKFGGDYGLNKIAAENVLKSKVPEAYILRPAYIYGPYNNLYRESFVFDCAKDKRPFYLPKKGEMGLQFIHVDDICRLIEQIIQLKPLQKIYNMGNEELVSIKEWVSICYEIVGEEVTFIEVDESINQSAYFSFSDYQYELDVTHQNLLLKETTDLKKGLKESWEWYQNNESLVNKREYLDYIEKYL